MTIYDVFSMIDNTETAKFVDGIVPHLRSNLGADYAMLALMTGAALCAGVLAIRAVVRVTSGGHDEWRRTEHIVPRAGTDHRIHRLASPLQLLGWRK